MHINDGLLLPEELRQRLDAATNQMKVFFGLVMHSEYVAEHQTRIIPDEIGVPKENRLQPVIQLVLDIFAVDKGRLPVLRYLGSFRRSALLGGFRRTQLPPKRRAPYSLRVW